MAPVRVTRSRAVPDVVHRPAELFDPAVGPHPLGVVEGAVAVGPLLRHHDDLELLEAQRHVEPPEPPAPALVGGAARGVRIADRADPPRTVAAAEPGGGVDGERRAGDPHLTGPRAHLREPRALQDVAEPVADHMRLFLDRRERALPGEVEADPVLVAVAHHPHTLERVEDLDAVGTDPLVHAIRTERVGEACRVHRVAQLHGGVGVDHAEVGVGPEAGDHEDLAGAVVRVEVAAVVEVLVAGADLAHRQRRLVDRELVERMQHGGEATAPGQPVSPPPGGRIRRIRGPCRRRCPGP